MKKYRLTKTGDPIITRWKNRETGYSDYKRLYRLTPAEESIIKEVEYLSARINQLIKENAHLKQTGEAQETRADFKNYLKAIRKASIRLEAEMYNYKYDFIELKQGEE